MLPTTYRPHSHYSRDAQEQMQANAIILSETKNSGCSTRLARPHSGKHDFIGSGMHTLPNSLRASVNPNIAIQGKASLTQIDTRNNPYEQMPLNN